MKTYRNKIYFWLVILSLFSGNTVFSQNKTEIRDCIIMLFDIKEIHPYLFSLEGDNQDSILCLIGRSYRTKDDLVILETEDFKIYKKHNIYVKAPSFIIGYNVDYWMSVDSVQVKENLLKINFKTTSYYNEKSEYTYLKGEATFEKINEDWRIKNKNIQIGEYEPPFIVNSEYVKKVRDRNQAF